MPYLIQSDEFRLIRELGRLFNLRKGEFQPGPPENHERVSSDVEFIDFELRHAFTFKDFPRNLELAEFEQCQGKLKCLCLLLEGLVSDQYTQKPPHGVEDQILAYPRLRKLIHHMQSTSGVLDLVYGCNKSIFSLPHGSDLANCLRVINECNGAFRRLHAPPAQAATLNNSAKREQKRKWKKARIRNRATFVLDGVFRHFRCGTQHEVLLKLFEDPDENLELPSLELVFSRCPDSRLLQEVRCGSVILNEMSIQSIPNICTGLQEQIGRGKELFLCIEEYGLFGAWADSTSATNPSSKESLNQLIVDGAFEPRSRNINAVMVGSSQTKFSTREKRALAVKLGFCLMDFFDADFNSKKIYFLDSANQAEKREIPYLAFRSQLPASSESYNFKMGHPHPALLSFAKLLIEMDCGQMIKLDIDRDYTRNRDAWLKLLDIVDEIQGDVGESYLQAIRGCLLAHQKIAEALGSRERGRKDADSKVRKKIYKEIVQKLEQGLSEATPRSDLKRRRSKSPPPAESEDHRQLLSSWTGSRRRSKRAFSKASISKRERTDEMHGSPFSGVSTLAMRGVTESFAHGIKIQASDQMIVPRDTCRPTRRKDFEIAVVCALPIEFNAVSLLVDQFWDEEGDVYGRAVGDENTYTTGRIGKFNVVLALLPNMGKISAAGSAASLRASFPRLRLVMLTGICGGVPRPGTDEELLLGDVVISKTVLQYDHGRLYPDRFAMKDTLEDAVGRPTKNIRNLVSLLETDLIRERIEQRAAFFLEELQGNSRGGRRRRANYEYPGADNDNLFEASFRHKHYSTEGECVCTACFKASDPVCDETSKMTCSHLGCHTDRIVSRQRIKEKRQLESDGRTKEAQAPLIFVGRVGSGDMVIKSGEVRDKIAKEHDILAFEMEGAGVLDEIPCIVAKGVCDYADSHKNKSWQAFAAATAASVTKALLERYTQTDNPHEAASNAVQSSFVPRDRY